MATAALPHAHPVVRAFETDEAFVVEVELPTASAPLALDLQEHSLTIRVPVPHAERAWRVNGEASGV